jgi:hypothetical protein
MNEKTIPFDQEIAEEQMLNNAVKANQAAEMDARYAAANSGRIAKAIRNNRIAAIKHMAIHGFCWLAGCATLIILAHIGDIAGYLMHIGTTVWSVALGIQIGKTV